jgi:hypothetical protein
LLIDLAHFNSRHLLLSVQISVAQIFVYKWPIESENKNNSGNESEESEQEKLNKIYLSNMNDLFILQEQISEYLGVKSFKRKYPGKVEAKRERARD